VFLINSRQGYFRCAPLKAGRLYPEVTTAFLPSSLTKFHPFTLAHLRPPTCVGFRYGFNTLSSTGFSRQLICLSSPCLNKASSLSLAFKKA